MGKSLQFPGFRFKPTDEELVMYYLKRKVLGKKLDPKIIAEINIYDFSPSDLPAKSILSGDLEWYFICPQSKKYSTGSRRNRATETGYWKVTGKDREVKCKDEGKGKDGEVIKKERTLASIKTLVFHVGRPRSGTRTNWVMHEYMMKDEDLANIGVAQEAYVICKVFKKSGVGPQNGAQYGAPFKEEEWDDEEESIVVTSPGVVSLSENPNNARGSGVMNMISMEAGPSTVTSSVGVSLSGFTKTLDPNASTSRTVTSFEDNNTQEVEDHKVKKVFTFEELVNPNYVSCSRMMNMTSTVTPSAKMVDPNASTSAPSTIKYWANERQTADDIMLTYADKASLLQNDNTQEVEDRKGKKVMTVPVEEDVWFSNKLATMNNLDDLGQDAFDDMLDIDGLAGDYSLDDAFIPDDFFKFSED